MIGRTPVNLWSVRDLRARWFALTMLGVLTGLTVGLAVASFDGAARTGSALTRLERTTNASDAALFASQASFERPNWDRLRARPEVQAVAPWTLIFGVVAGQDGVVFAPSDDVLLQQVDRPIVVEGRMFDPDAIDEMVVSVTGGQPPEFTLGSIVHMDVYGSFDPSAPPGPSVDFRVVGLIRTALDYELTGAPYVTPGFLRAYEGRLASAENANVQLRDGTDVDEFRRHATEDVFPGIPVLDFAVTARRVTATTDVERAMLLLLGGIIAVASLLFIGHSIARSAATVAGDAQSLRAIGMTRADLVAAGLRPHLLTAAVAVVVTALTAVVASQWFPIGLAAEVDPDRGVRVHAVATLAASGVAALLVAGLSAVVAWTVTDPAPRPPRERPSWTTRLGLLRPVPVALGVRMALEGGRRGSGSSSRAALGGAIAAVAGVVAMLSLQHGLADALDHPEVAGIAWDATVMPADGDLLSLRADLVSGVRDAPNVAASAGIGRLVMEIDGVGVPTFALIDARTTAQVELVTLSGRAPTAPGEVVLGPSTARDLGVGIGDEVQLPDQRPATVVGLGLFPPDVHQQFDEGAWLDASRWTPIVDAITADVTPGEGGAEYLIAVEFAGDDTSREIAALSDTLGPDATVFAAELPEELTNLRNVQRAPSLLAVFLTVLGITAVGLGLSQSVRQRRKEIAVLRALGITRTGSGFAVAAQASTIAAAGLLGGIPIGLLAGRIGWRAITDRVPLTFRSPLALAAVILVVPIAIAIANALALLPARRATRFEPAVTLRTE